MWWRDCEVFTVTLPVRRSLRLLAYLALVSLLAACATVVTPGAPMRGTHLDASGNWVTLQWDADSPVAKMLAGRSSLYLLARIQTVDSAEHRDLIAQGTINRVGRSALFELPSRLDYVPIGEVCLAIVDPLSKLPLPIREAGHTDASAGFTIPGFSGRIRESSEAYARQNRVVELEASKARIEARLTQFEKWRIERGLSQASHCLNLSAPLSEESFVSFPNARASARESCMYRFTRAKKFGSEQGLKHVLNEMAVHYEDIKKRLSKGERESIFIKYDKMYTGFSADLDAFTPKLISPLYRPPLESDYFSIGAFASEINMTNKISLGAASALLESYGQCIDEAEHQIQLILEAQEHRKQSAAQRQNAAEKFVRNECKGKFQDANIKRQELESAEQEIVRLKAKPVALIHASNSPITTRDLQRASCAF